MSTPLVSVIMPVYNVERYVEESLRSVLRQTENDLEVVVVDDCSPDKSMAAVEAVNDARVRIIRHKVNMGLASARNSGLDVAAGTYVAFLDSDDVAMPQRLQRQCEFLKANPCVVLCGGAVACIDADGKPTGQRWRPPHDSTLLSAQLLFQNRFFVSTVMVRAEVHRCLRFRTDFPMAEDYEFNVRASHLGSVANLDETLIRYRLNPAGLTATKQTLMDEYVRKTMRTQVERLGISASDRQLDVHFHLYADCLPPSIDLLDEINDWLTVLAEANRKQKIFDEDAFRSVLSQHWFEACTRASSVGPRMLVRYAQGGFFSALSAPVVRHLKMLVKAAIGPIAVRD